MYVGRARFRPFELRHSSGVFPACTVYGEFMSVGRSVGVEGVNKRPPLDFATYVRVS